MRLKSIPFAALALFLFGNICNAQSSQESIVKTYGNYMSEWCKTSDDTYRKKIDGLVQGNIECRVDDGIMQIFVSKDKSGLLSSGTSFMDSYLNCITNAIKDGLVYTHGTPVWQKDYTEPTAFNDKTEAPLYFVSMDIDTKGSLNFSGTDLFFVRGRQITKIVDFKDDNSLAKAIELYSSHKYEDAFRLFRKLAYEDPGNYDAQYYTAVMEIKKQGCGYLGSKVRDIEAAWWLVRGVLANSIERDWSKDRMAKLCVRFAVDETPLPFNNVNKEFYIKALISKQLFTQGLMAYKNKKGMYGFMNEAGTLVVPCKYNLVHPFDKAGHALVAKNGKIGYIDTEGNEIVPVKYDSGVTQFKDGKTYVILDGNLLLIDEKGTVLKEVGKGYETLSPLIVCGKAYAYNKTSKLYYLYDLEGNITSVESESYSIDLKQNCYVAGIHEESFGWK